MKYLNKTFISLLTLFLLCASCYSEGKYARVIKSSQGVVTKFETAIVHLASQNNPSIFLDLIAAVHIGDPSYYQSLNEKFTHYDAILYELIAESGITIKKGDHSNPLSLAQNSLKSLLDLSFQLDEINYQAKNLIHADLSPREFNHSMAQRGETFTSMLFSLATEASHNNTTSTSEEVQSLKLLLSFISPRRSVILKRTLAEELTEMDSLMTMFVEKNNGSTILTVRNEKALSVAQSEIAKGKKHLGIFYGAAHLQDMEQKLTTLHGFKRTSEDWEPAWELSN